MDNSKPAWLRFKLGSDLYDPYDQGAGYYLDVEAGQKAIDFIETFCTHVRGKYKGKPFLLDPWLKAIIGHLYGWRSEETGLRRYRELLLLCPRKQAKSLLSAAMALLELFFGDKNGPEIIIASGTRDQAGQLFETISIMIRQNKALSKRLQMYKNIIKYPEIDGWLKVVSSEANNLHGGNLSCGIIDELHIVQRDLVEVMQTSQGSREAPLMVNLSTAGYDRHTILYEKYEYAKKVHQSIIIDPAFFPIVYEAAPEDDWTDPKVWARCNPGLGRSINLDFMQRECARAQESPAFEATFKRLYLNIWTEAESPWLAMAKYDACVIGDMPDLTGRPCYAGLDLSSALDLSAFVLCFPPIEDEDIFYILPFAWCPGDAVRDRSKRDHVPYDVWQRQGHIEACPGPVIDYAYIFRCIDDCAREYDLKAVCFDRYGASRISQELEANGILMVEMGQGYASMSPPTKEMEKMILEQKICFPENPVLRWNFSNIVIEQDSAGNIKPSKKRSVEKIDMVVAAIMALDGAVRNQIKNSVYDEREMILL